VLALVLVLALVGFGIYIDTQLIREPALVDYPGRPADTAGTNWLIVGSDSRADLTEQQEEQLTTGSVAGRRTDTIMLLHTGNGPTTLVSLPRDSLVSIPGRRGQHKLNAAFAFGGAELLVRTVEQETDLRIDHYAEVGFGGFVSVVDAVGGVEMCVPEAIKDPLAGLNVKAGCQTLDGPTALGYVRTRATARADLERIERQRAFLAALMAKATSPATLVNPFRFVPMATGIAGAVTVDTNDHVWNLLGLALGMRGVSNGGITTTVPIASATNAGVRWDKTSAGKLFDALREDQPPPASVVGR
jgi:LCP family protein required for cell wall assembly